MRDPKVFGSAEESSPDDSQEIELALVLEPLPSKDAEIQYGSALSHIQASDLAKCSFQRPLSEGYFSQSMPLRRLSRELKHFVKDHLQYISVAPIEDNPCNVLGSIEGPPGTPYEGGVFFIRMDCPDSYPVRPPVCNFITKIYHPNISQGRICVDILEDAWCPALTLETTLLSICSMLSEPFFDSPLDKEIAAEHEKDKAIYEHNARVWTQKYATGERPTDEELEIARESNERLAVILDKNRSARRRWDEDESARGDGLW